MNSTDLLQKLDERIQARSILQHPFYIAWQQGELTRDQLATYAAVYYPHVAAFPGYLTTAVAQTDDPVIRHELEENLADELSNPKPHPELWLDFAAEFGLDSDDVTAAPAHDGAQNIVDTFNQLASDSVAAGVTALYAYESQQSEVARQKMDGLRAFYGVDNPRSLAYFDVHAEADVAHSAGERDVIARCLAAGAAPETMLAAADKALDSYWGLLDGICDAAGIPLN